MRYQNGQQADAAKPAPRANLSPHLFWLKNNVNIVKMKINKKKTIL